ncbi:MAG TPA: hypothetical protein VLA56_05255 [Pseudomonadales bacterium]|nr:hypothetical protein [Pseudomonadales bacterium]
MTNPKGENLDGMPTIAPSRDDIESRRTSRKAPVPAGTASATGGLVVNVVMAVLLAGLTACGWFIVNQSDALEQARAERDQADARLVRIENRLSMTDQALSNTESETQTQLQFWESEIRKLWDVTNKRNRTWIEENQASVKKLQASLDTQNRSLTEVKAQAADLRKALGTQDQMLEQLTLLDRRASDLVNQQRLLVDSVNTLKQSSGVMEKRVADNEEAIRAIDAFRRDAVARLQRLQDRIDTLASAAATGASARPAPTLTPST